MTVATRIAVFVLLIFCRTILAEDREQRFPRLLSGNEPSYLVWAVDGGAQAEFYISIRYPLARQSLVFLDRWFDGKKTAYFTYNGKYDFYLGTRFSSPVVSRLQNPGLSIKTKYDTPRMWGITDFSLGWFHESNGQNIETQQAYDLTNNARDYVSRGWDYLGVSIESQHQYEHKPLNAYLHLRLFCDCQAFGAIGEKEDSVFWKSVDKQPDIRDFDGLRIVLSFLKNKDLRFSTQFRLGTYALDSLTNVSTRLEITVRVKEIPLTVFYFTGYGSEIAYYQEKGHYLGVGLEFW